jgi:signal transduction histidine kinase
VKDDGKGFECNDCGNGNGNGHYGLLGIRERVGYLGGNLTIHSAPGAGTTVAIYVPSYRGGRSDRSRS